MAQSFYETLSDVGDSLKRVRKHLKAVNDNMVEMKSMTHHGNPLCDLSLDQVRIADDLVEKTYHRLDKIVTRSGGGGADIAEKGRNTREHIPQKEIIIEKVPVKQRSVKGFVVTIAVLIVAVLAVASACGYFYDRARKFERLYDSANEMVSSGRDELNALNGERKTLTEKLTELQAYKDNYIEHFPLVINSIEFGNGRYDSAPSIYGERLYASDIYYVYIRVNYNGETSGNKTFNIKWYRGNTMLTGNGSPSGCTYKKDADIRLGENSQVLGGWGNNQRGSSWEAGSYRVEIWCGDNFIASKNLTVY